MDLGLGRADALSELRVQRRLGPVVPALAAGHPLPERHRCDADRLRGDPERGALAHSGDDPVGHLGRQLRGASNDGLMITAPNGCSTEGSVCGNRKCKTRTTSYLL